MKVTPDDYGRRCQFDHFCKLVLYHEAVDYFRERKRQRGWETSFETLALGLLTASHPFGAGRAVLKNFQNCIPKQLCGFLLV